MRWGRLLGTFTLAAVAACSSSHGTRAGHDLSAPATTRVHSSTTPTTARVPGLPKFKHILVVIEENHGYDQIVGSSSAPYINSLIRTGTLLTQSYALTHPSQPNYVALFSGSLHGLTSDSCPHTFAGPDLYSALHAVGRDLTGYSENLPVTGSEVCFSHKYARKHAPWTDFSDVPDSANQPLTAFPSDYTKLPALSFVIPNLDHDMHDGTVGQADTWLEQHLADYVTWARTHDSLFVLTYDEDEGCKAPGGGENNRIPTVFVGAHVRPGHQYGDEVDHYRVLRTIEDVFGTQHLGESASRTPIAGIWN